MGDLEILRKLWWSCLLLGKLSLRDREVVSEWKLCLQWDTIDICEIFLIEETSENLGERFKWESTSWPTIEEITEFLYNDSVDFYFYSYFFNSKPGLWNIALHLREKKFAEEKEKCQLVTFNWPSIFPQLWQCTFHPAERPLAVDQKSRTAHILTSGECPKSTRTLSPANFWPPRGPLLASAPPPFEVYILKYASLL